MPDSLGSMRADLQDWLRFVNCEAHILKADPDLIWQQAANQPKQSAVSRRVHTLQNAGRWTDRPLLYWVNRPDRHSPQLMSLEVAVSSALAISSDGRCIVSAGGGDIQVWDSLTGRESHAFVAPGHEVTDLVITPDGRRAISTGHDRTIRIWDLDGCQELGSIALVQKAFALAITSNGQQFFSGNDYGTIDVG